MKKKLIILANAENLMAYRFLTEDDPLPHRRMENIETHLPHLAPDDAEATPDNGRFGSGSSRHKVPMRHGDPHGRPLGKRKRLLDEMATAICDIIDYEDFDIWNLSAPDDLCNNLLERLPMHVQNKLTQIKKADHTRQPIKKIEHLFS